MTMTPNVRSLIWLCAGIVALVGSHAVLAFTPTVRYGSRTLQPSSIITSSSLFSSSPPRQPRRMLKKRRRNPKSNKSGTILTPAQSFDWEKSESRPLVTAKRIEAGQDYWMDEEELSKFEAQQQAIKNREALEGEISKEKLMTEVVAPYKQNWIGYFSVFIAIISTIVIKFPELLDQPTIGLPDL